MLDTDLIKNVNYSDVLRKKFHIFSIQYFFSIYLCEKNKALQLHKFK